MLCGSNVPLESIKSIILTDKERCIDSASLDNVELSTCLSILIEGKLISTSVMRQPVLFTLYVWSPKCVYTFFNSRQMKLLMIVEAPRWKSSAQFFSSNFHIYIRTAQLLKAISFCLAASICLKMSSIICGCHKWKRKKAYFKSKRSNRLIDIHDGI